MTDYIRRIVSGNKARFKDVQLNLELDLIYLTDHIIIMGYPATGIESFYRNRREDAKRFLDQRHGKNYWVFNFCPIRENSYSASFFDDRVSRYPFPDHHAPPLAILPLVAREIRIWLEGSSDRVAVLHCKAGKGRSGTMACSYLLSLDIEATPPKLERSYTAEEWAKKRADDVLTSIPDDVDDLATRTNEQATESVLEGLSTGSSLHESSHSDAEASERSPSVPSLPARTKSFADSLKGVLDLHTARRMKAPPSNGKVRQGVSIPSQRRWLTYWSLLLAGEAPPHLWSSQDPSTGALSIKQAVTIAKNRPKVRLTEIKVKMKLPSLIKKHLVRAANALIDRTSMTKTQIQTNGEAHVWVSLARYDDELVETLERWERYTRDPSDMGKRRTGSAHVGHDSVSDIFKDGKWDSHKMVRSFARMGVLKKNIIRGESEKGEKTVTYVLSPLSGTGWEEMREAIEQEKTQIEAVNNSELMPASETNSLYEITNSSREKGIILDATREVRIKLYMGQVFLGWLWLIPIFHMPPPTSSMASEPSLTRILLTRKELDFPLGLGNLVIDIEISFEWMQAHDSEVMQPAAATSETEKLIGTEEDATSTVASAIAAHTVDVAQAAEL